MVRKIEVRRENAKFDLLIPVESNDSYTDGVGQLMVGPVMSKILFYTSLGLDETTQTEERLISLRLQMPTASLYELAKAINDALAENKDGLSAQLDTTTANFKENLQKLSR